MERDLGARILSDEPRARSDSRLHLAGVLKLVVLAGSLGVVAYVLYLFLALGRAW
jgi:hypothetical protein